jgi:hypothetical protein
MVLVRPYGGRYVNNSVIREEINGYGESHAQENYD